MTTKAKRSLMPYVQAFFEEYLAVQDGLFQNPFGHIELNR